MELGSKQILLLGVVVWLSVGDGSSGPVLGRVAEFGVRVFLENAPAFDAGAPLAVNARRHRWPDEQIVAFAYVLDLVVMTDLLHVRPVVELTTDTDQHYLSVFQVLRCLTVH